jgi:ATP/maltotriose-dependent transcriptional regulator MalT
MLLTASSVLIETLTPQLPEAKDLRQQANEALIEPLTERELEVLGLLGEGRSNREIAKALIVVVGTVKSHVHNICQKLSTDNRTQAVLKAKQLGLIS